MGKKIGIITFCDNTNYGSYLQTYALYKSVKMLGYSVEVIDYRKKVPDYEMVTLKSLPRLIEQQGYDYGLSLWINIFHMQLAFKRIMKQSMKMSRMTYTTKSIGQCSDKYDIYLVGSDLVWDIRYADDYTYMLDFVPDNRVKLAYAASYGYDEIPVSEKEYFRRYLSKFSHISVREYNNKIELENLLGRNIEHVCDPTMLLPNYFWKKQIGENTQKRDYILIYMPDDEKKIIGEAKRYARKHRLNIYMIDKKKREYCPRTPKDFLTLIYYASKVYTGSYHGLLFSVYFEKKFSYINRKPGNRLKTVTEILNIDRFNIESREYDMENEPDYNEIKRLETEFREKSLKILRKMLKDGEKQYMLRL